MNTVIAFEPHRRLRNEFAAHLDTLAGVGRLTGAKIHTTKRIGLDDLERMFEAFADRTADGVHCWDWAIWGRPADGGPLAEALGVDGHRMGMVLALESGGALAFVVIDDLRLAERVLWAMRAAEAAEAA